MHSPALLPTDHLPPHDYAAERVAGRHHCRLCGHGVTAATRRAYDAGVQAGRLDIVSAIKTGQMAPVTPRPSFAETAAADRAYERRLASA